MKNGIFSNDQDGVFGLFKDDECLVISTEYSDCLEEAKSLGIDPKPTDTKG